MEYLILETAALLAAAYFLGAMLACFIRRLFFAPSVVIPVESTAQWQSTPLTTGVQVSTAAPVVEAGVQLQPATVHSDSKRFERALSEAPQQRAAGFEPVQEKIEIIETPPVRDVFEAPPEQHPEQHQEDSSTSEVVQQETSLETTATSSVSSTVAGVAAAVAGAGVAAATMSEATSESDGDEIVPPSVPISDDDLTRIQSIDDVVARSLNENGIYSFQDVANLSPEEIRGLEFKLGLPEKITNENWVAQASLLASGGQPVADHDDVSESAVDIVPSLADDDLSDQRFDDEDSGLLGGRSSADVATTAAAAVAVATAAANRAMASKDDDVADDAAVADIAQTDEHPEPEQETEPEIEVVEAEVEVVEAQSDPTPDVPSDEAHETTASPDAVRFGFGNRTHTEQAVITAAAVAAATAAANRTTGVIQQQEDTAPPTSEAASEASADVGEGTSDNAPAPTIETRPTQLADAIKDKAEQADSVSAGVVGLRSVKSSALVGGRGELGEADDLKRIRGIGVLVEKKLNSVGISTFAQIAQWSPQDVKQFSEVLDFQGRIEREQWVEQAQLLGTRH